MIQKAMAKPMPPLHDAATAFLGTLNPEQRAKAALPFDADERMNWHFVPRPRQGLPLRQMEAKQRDAALALLRAGLSAQGYKKAETIRSLENVLREMENDRDGNFRNPDLYYVTIFGEPAGKGVWGWRYEGHHLSLNWTIINGAVIASSPQFLGANPANVRREGPYLGTRALAAEEDLGRALVKSLTPEQRAVGVISDKAPADILTAAQRQAALLEDKGIAFKSLTKEQQGLLLALIREHAAGQSATVANKRLAALRKAGLDDVKFAWMGGLEPGTGHYYRVQGKTFLIEYDNTQNQANHIHAVWRDFTGDFGRDLLAEHYHKVPHGK